PCFTPAPEPVVEPVAERSFHRAPEPAAEPVAEPAFAEPVVIGVAELDQRLKRLLEHKTADVRVRGEIRGLKQQQSGHVYFTLKDETEDAVIDCAMFRAAAARVRTPLRDGDRIVVSGRATVFAPRGKLQLVVERVLETGRGSLLLALEKLKAKLQDEGLFDPAKKRALPTEPRTIAVVTSREGAAFTDVRKVAFARGAVTLVLVHTSVQGAAAPEEIVRALELVSRTRGFDAVIVTRGGGSAEDLAAFNDERVVRAVAASKLPIISAIGHEVDFTLCDLAADFRAATPSQAAERLVPSEHEQRAALAHLVRRVERGVRHRLATDTGRLSRLEHRLGEPRHRLHEAGQRLDELAHGLERTLTRSLRARRQALLHSGRRLDACDPRRVVSEARARLVPLLPRLVLAMRGRLGLHGKSLAEGAARLDALSPLAVLGRGYAILTSSAGHVVTNAALIHPGELVTLRLERGSIAARAEKIFTE
ncbi:MAG: exodeoxyribonuclease VII large subunit, partial [Myxococcales bacterium]|nr:exodeoxyribonuclease VII large subunit [Myxococcales bacterium]